MELVSLNRKKCEIGVWTIALPEATSISCISDKLEQRQDNMPYASQQGQAFEKAQKSYPSPKIWLSFLN
uniref:Uncharacterized protein n=1 Tax=Sphaerodactylus townsendi TaxID=933632 RepID=A0ACB8F2V3_9SAUR